MTTITIIKYWNYPSSIWPLLFKIKHVIKIKKLYSSSCIYSGSSFIYSGYSCIYSGYSCINSGSNYIYSGFSCIYSDSSSIYSGYICIYAGSSCIYSASSCIIWFQLYISLWGFWVYILVRVWNIYPGEGS